MGTFIGHIVPGLALALLGLWHTINTIKSYLLNGSDKFRTRFWYPFDGPFFRSQFLELILILSFSLFAIVLQLLDYPLLRFVFELDNFEHATMFLHLAVFAMFTISAELSHSSELLSGFSGILAASVFTQELFLLHFHSTDHIGLEGHYHWLLQLIVFVSLIAAMAAASFRNSFSAALLLSISVVFQGCWFMNMGFMLWVPDYVPKGCTANSAKASGSVMQGAVICATPDAEMRAKALANLQFSWMLSGILMLVGCISLKLARKYTTSHLAYEQLQSRSSEVAISLDDFKQAHP